MCRKKEQKTAVRDFVLLMDFFSTKEEIESGSFHIDVELPDDDSDEETETDENED